MSDNTDKKIAVIVEKEEDKTAYFTYELLTAGKMLSDVMTARFVAIVVGNNVAAIAQDVAGFVDAVYVIDNPVLQTFHADIYAAALADCLTAISADTVIMGHTLDNIDLAPKIALRLGASLVTDIVKIEGTPSGKLSCEKPIYGDKAMASFALDKTPRMITLRPKTMIALDKREKLGIVTTYIPVIDPCIAKVVFVEKVPGESVSLDKAEAIVAGGRGIKEKENIRYLEDLSNALKRFFPAVELGASRPLVDSGFFPPSRQIGLTGEKVAPELYVAVAISGASQHLSGITGSKKIVAINKDEQASIFESADYGVVGEYEKVIPALVRKLKELP